MHLSNFTSSISSLFFPQLCIACERRIRNSPLCPGCLDILLSNPGPYITTLSHVKKVISCRKYANITRTCLRSFKYQGRLSVANIFAPVILKTLGTVKEYGKIDLIITVPLHKKRIKERGFNQSDVLARYVAEHFGSVAKEDCLIKVRNTLPQAGLCRKNRINNLSGTFRVINPENIHQKRVLLVDDVMTTGATLDACGKELLRAGAKEVLGFTIAKTL